MGWVVFRATLCLIFAERGSAGGERSDPAALPRVAPFPFARGGARGRRQALGGVRGGLAPPGRRRRSLG